MPTLVITRPQPEAAHWAGLLQARGLATRSLPLIEIAACEDAPARAVLAQARQRLADGAYRALMFVSGNAARYFFASFEAPAQAASALAAHKTRAWAPGPGTVRALLAAGVPAEAIAQPAADAAQFDSEALWQQVAGQVRPGDRVLLVRGSSAGHGDGGTEVPGEGSGRQWLMQQLQAAGASVDLVAVYARRAPQDSAWVRAQARAAVAHDEIWLFSSSEALQHLQQLCPGQDWRHARALATHPRIAQMARAVGFGHIRECRPALEDIVASIESRP